MLRTKSKLNATYKKVAQAYRTSGGNYLFEIDNTTYVFNTMYKTVSKVIYHEQNVNIKDVNSQVDTVYLDTLNSMNDVELRLYVAELANYNKAIDLVLTYSGYNQLHKRLIKLHKEVEDAYWNSLDLDPDTYRYFH